MKRTILHAAALTLLSTVAVVVRAQTVAPTTDEPSAPVQPAAPPADESAAPPPDATAPASEPPATPEPPTAPETPMAPEPSPADVAPTQPQPPVATPTPQPGVEEIVVTAQKREQRAQDVPLAMSVFSATDLADAGVLDVLDLAELTPGFTMAPLFGGAASTPVIRGMSTTIGEPNVGFFVDGVYQASRATMDAALTNGVERVEIVKGTQSALYGRNTFAGAVNIITRRPTQDHELFVGGTLGDYGRRGLRLGASGPVKDELLQYRLGIDYTALDGFYTNELVDRPLDRRRTAAYSLGLLSEPAARLELDLRLAYGDTNDGDDVLRFVDNNGAFYPPFNDYQMYDGAVPGYTDGYAVTPGHFNRDHFTSSLRASYEMDNAVLTSTTGANRLRIDQVVDNDYDPRLIRSNHTRIHLDELSEELRAVSSATRRLRWLFGAVVYAARSTTDIDDRYVGLAEGNGGLVNETREGTTSYAAFGQVDFDVVERLELSVGGRYAYEIKTVRAVDTNLLDGAQGVFEDEAAFGEVTPRVALSYHLAKQHLVYASAARAAKSGGFNVVTAAGAISDEERTYDPESSWQYALGTKSAWFGRRVSLDVALFLTKWKDQIVRAIGSNNATLNANAGRTTAQGVEVSAEVRPLAGLELSAGGAYTDSHYDSYTFGALRRVGVDPVLDGKPLQYVSKWTCNGSAQYTWFDFLFGSAWVTRVDGSFRTRQTAIQTGTAWVPQALLVNARTGIRYGDTSVFFWVRNLTNDLAPATAVFLPSWASAYDTTQHNRPGYEAFQGLITGPTPRSFGVTAEVSLY